MHIVRIHTHIIGLKYSIQPNSTLQFTAVHCIYLCIYYCVTIFHVIYYIICTYSIQVHSDSLHYVVMCIYVPTQTLLCYWLYLYTHCIICYIVYMYIHLRMRYWNTYYYIISHVTIIPMEGHSSSQRYLVHRMIGTDALLGYAYPLFCCHSSCLVGIDSN